MVLVRGDYVEIFGLESRPDLNGKEGAILKQYEETKRFEVELTDMQPEKVFSLKPNRLKRLGQSCVVIGPCDKGISSEEVPIYTSYLAGPSKGEEVEELKSR